MSDEIKKPEEVTDVPVPQKELEKELETVVGGESVQFNFSKIEYTYTPQKSDGSTGAK
jgi:hypothetical protein